MEAMGATETCREPCGGLVCHQDCGDGFTGVGMG